MSQEYRFGAWTTDNIGYKYECNKVFSGGFEIPDKVRDTFSKKKADYPGLIVYYAACPRCGVVKTAKAISQDNPHGITEDGQICTDSICIKC